MIIYLLILFLVILWVGVFYKGMGFRVFLIPALILIFFGTIRDISVGTDSAMYSRVFMDNIAIQNFYFDPRLEYGYQYLVYLILHIGKEYYLLFLFTSMIVVTNNLYAIKKFSEDYLFSVYIYITMGFFTFYFNTLRQAIAMSIILLGMNFIVDKKLVNFIVLILFASLFHTSALIMLPIYFLIHHVNVSIIYKVVISAFSSILLSGGIIAYMAENNDKYSHYMEDSDKAGGYFYIILYCLIGFFLVYFGRKLRLINLKYNVLEQIYICGVAFTVPLIFLGTDPSGPKRVVYYFLMYLIFIIPIILREINILKLNIIVYFLLLIYFMYITYNIWGIYPYSVNPYFIIF